LPDDFGEKEMGGTGSGRIFHYTTKPTLEQYRAIDVRQWKRTGHLGRSGGFSWIWTRNGEEKGRIEVHPAPDHVRLVYRTRRNDGPWQPVDDMVRITTTPCSFGGSRLWFVCPGCGRRAARLCCSTAYFRCRKCCGVPYTSQMQSDFDRAIARREKLFGKLEGAPYRKPKGMHRRTFEAIWAQIERQQTIIDGLIVDRFGNC
jgi:hypothetical protein